MKKIKYLLGLPFLAFLLSFSFLSNPVGAETLVKFDTSNSQFTNVDGFSIFTIDTLINKARSVNSDFDQNYDDYSILIESNTIINGSELPLITIGKGINSQGRSPIIFGVLNNKQVFMTSGYDNSSVKQYYFTNPNLSGNLNINLYNSGNNYYSMPDSYSEKLYYIHNVKYAPEGDPNNNSGLSSWTDSPIVWVPTTPASVTFKAHVSGLSVTFTTTAIDIAPVVSFKYQTGDFPTSDGFCTNNIACLVSDTIDPIITAVNADGTVTSTQVRTYNYVKSGIYDTFVDVINSYGVESGNSIYKLSVGGTGDYSSPAFGQDVPPMPTQVCMPGDLICGFTVMLGSLFIPNGDDISKLFSDFNTNNFNIGQIIALPLTTIGSLATSSCSPINIPLPFMGRNVTLPCYTPIYQANIGVLWTLYQVILTGTVSYLVAINSLALAKKIKDPTDDKIEVFHL